MTPLAAEPAEEGPLQQLGVEPISLRPPMLTRTADTCCVDCMGFDTARPQPPRQPEAIPRPASKACPWLEQGATTIRLTVRPASSPVAPAMQQPKQPRLRRRQFF